MPIFSPMILTLDLYGWKSQQNQGISRTSCVHQISVCVCVCWTFCGWFYYSVLFSDLWGVALGL